MLIPIDTYCEIQNGEYNVIEAYLFSALARPLYISYPILSAVVLESTALSSISCPPLNALLTYDELILSKIFDSIEL